MAAGFPSNNQGVFIGGKGGPQIQPGWGSMIGARFGGGGYFGQGPQSPTKKRGYQLTRPGMGRGGGDSMEGGLGQGVVTTPTPGMAGGFGGGSLGPILSGVMGRGGAGAGAFQDYGQPPNRNRLGLENIAGSMGSPEGAVQGDKTLRNVGLGLGDLQNMSSVVGQFRGMAPMQRQGGGYGAPIGSTSDSLLKRMLMSRFGGGM